VHHRIKQKSLDVFLGKTRADTEVALARATDELRKARKAKMEAIKDCDDEAEQEAEEDITDWKARKEQWKCELDDIDAAASENTHPNPPSLRKKNACSVAKTARPVAKKPPRAAKKACTEPSISRTAAMTMTMTMTTTIL